MMGSAEGRPATPLHCTQPPQPPPLAATLPQSPLMLGLVFTLSTQGESAIFVAFAPASLSIRSRTAGGLSC
jgi:hypothetical protein